MPTVLRDNQHELLDKAGNTLLLFGTRDTGYPTTTYPAIGPDDGSIGDQPGLREDGVVFGEDYAGAETITFELIADGSSPGGTGQHGIGNDLLRVLKSVWKKKGLRENGAYAVLRSQMSPGKTVRAYGRPRRYADTASNMTTKGVTEVVCDFVVQDGRWYDDAEQSQSVDIIPATRTGFTAPIIAPLLTIVPTRPSIVGFEVGGSEPTWMVTTFTGPILNPSAVVGGFRIGLNMSLAPGQSVTIDPRPWRRSVLDNSGASYAGKLSWDTPPLDEMLVEPGNYTLTLDGTDATGTAYAAVKWRNAWPRW